MRQRQAISSGLFLHALASAVLLLSITATALPQGARAQDFPQRVIRIVVPFPPGGPSDVAARLIAQSLSSRLGQNVIVDNQAGAGGRVGSKAVAGAAPDGYTLLVGGTNSITAALAKNPGFDAVTSFSPIAVIAADSIALAVYPGLPAETPQQLIALAKKNPGQLKYGTPPGINTHFLGEFFKFKSGSNITFVPYRGGAPALTDTLGGHIDMTLSTRTVLLPYLREAKLRALVTTGDKRWPEIPNTPTMAESGIDGFPAEVLHGLLAPAGTPQPIVDKINSAVNESLKLPDVKASFAKLGIEPKPVTPQEFAALIVQQAKQFREIMEATGITVD